MARLVLLARAQNGGSDRGSSLAAAGINKVDATRKEEDMKRHLASAATMLALIAVGGQAFAAWVQSPERYVEIVSVEGSSIDPDGPGVLYVGFSSTPATTNCSYGNTLWKVGGDTEFVKAIQSAALAAKLSRVRVEAIYNNSYSGTWTCSGGGTTGYPVLRGLIVRPE